MTERANSIETFMIVYFVCPVPGCEKRISKPEHNLIMKEKGENDFREAVAEALRRGVPSCPIHHQSMLPIIERLSEKR